jgi:hypothetical protein
VLGFVDEIAAAPCRATRVKDWSVVTAFVDDVPGEINVPSVAARGPIRPLHFLTDEATPASSARAAPGVTAAKAASTATSRIRGR